MNNPHIPLLLSAIIDAVTSGRYEFVYVPDHHWFSVKMLDPEQRERFKRAILASRASVVSFPGAGEIADVCGDGASTKTLVTDSVWFVPPRNIVADRRAEDAGLQWLSDYVAALEAATT